MIIDTHAHLTSEKFAGEVDAVIARARSAGVGTIVSIASDLDDARKAIDIAEGHPEVFATVGVHPHAAESVQPDTFDRLRELARHPRVVGIGETGLDYFYDSAPRAQQIDAFRSHLELAREVEMPVVVHCRDADDDVANAMREVGWRRGVLHCFSGGKELLDFALSYGWYISFAGMVTFKKWDAADLLRAVPLDRLLVETDSPYLAPAPLRGQRNEPANVRLVAARAAEIRGEDTDAFAAATAANARAFYGLDGEL